VILATQADVEARLGRDLSSEEEERLDGLLVEASALVEGYLGVVYDDDDDTDLPSPPSVVAVVVSKIVARAFTASTVEGPASLTAGPYSVTYRDNTSLWLSKGEKLMLRNIGGGFTSIGMKSDREYPECD
jgi:hypothetical protein